MDWRGTTTLITGASSGIGAAFARRIAAAGGNVVLVARRADRLQALAAELEQRHGVSATVLAADLAAGSADLLDAVDRAGITVDGLINNAGFATRQDLHREVPARIEEEIALNVQAVVALTRALLPGMLARRRGVVINVASTAAFQPVPHMAVYGATKAFVLSFTEALWGETRGTGVRVLALAPGATQTEFFKIAGESASVGRRETPERVVETALRALDRPGRSSVVSGLANRATAFAVRFLPRTAAIVIAGRAVAPTPEEQARVPV